MKYLVYCAYMSSYPVEAACMRDVIDDGVHRWAGHWNGRIVEIQITGYTVMVCQSNVAARDITRYGYRFPSMLAVIVTSDFSSVSDVWDKVYRKYVEMVLTRAGRKDLGAKPT